MQKQPLRYSTYLTQFGWKLFAVVALLLAVSPFLVLLFQLYSAVSVGEVQFEGGYLLGNRRGLLFLRSVLWAMAVGGGGMMLSVLAVFGLNNLMPNKQHQWIWFLLVLMCLPAYLQAIGWQTLAQWLGIGGLAHGWVVSWWVQMMVYFPLAVVLAFIGLNTVDASVLEAASLHYPGWKVFRNIWLPLARPYLIASVCILFVLSVGDYTIPSLFQVNSYPLEIFAEFSASGKPETAVLLALPLVLFVIMLVFMVIRQLRPVDLEAVVKRPALVVIENWDWPAVFIGMQNVSVALLFIQFLLPIVALVSILFNSGQFFITFRESFSDLAYSLLISIAGAILAVLFAFPISRVLVFAKKKITKLAVGLVVVLPLAMPASIVGVGMIALLSRPIFSFGYGTNFGLVFSFAVRFFPIAVLVLVGQWQRAGNAWLDAARLLDANPFRRFVKIILPVSAPTIFAAFLFVLALNLGELGASLLVIPPGRSTLTIRIYNYLHYGAGEAVAGMSLGLVFIIVGIGLLALVALQFQNRRKIRA